ncbi:Hypothetical protein LRC_17090 [Ligilactobacillus ruminis ATCC 27782]|uniref:Uncharacterized protein n=1 Tax=Ligilactobacillus ruminis (strain ATCC 27782 / RF3) TaxID=1069534 RepID=G2SS03_LIGR2|nr:Hypothetical protein LRC_17090 [Ligilactobacillus ruminis ATCC 27782]
MIHNQSQISSHFLDIQKQIWILPVIGAWLLQANHQNRRFARNPVLVH